MASAASSSQKTQVDYFYIAMSSAAAGTERDAAEGAAVAHVPGMDDRIAALKAERQALKRQLQQASREVKAQAGQGTTSSLCVPYLCWVYRDYISPTLHLHLHILTFVWLKLL